MSEEETKPAELQNTDETTPASPSNTTKPTSNQPKSTPAKKQPAKTQPKKVTATPGTVNSLSARTGNFYIIVGSFLDEDMAMDFATKLSNAGKSPSIIPPFGNAITHRVAISGYGTLSEAQNSIDGLKPEYGQDIWILRY